MTAAAIAIEPPSNAAVLAAVDFLVTHYQDQPSLEDLAGVAGMSPFHFQRVFKERIGISPKRFGQFLTVEHAKALLTERQSVLDTALEVGLSGPSRLHDLFVACEAMTPGEYKEEGRDLTIRWGIHEGPVGRALIGLTDRGVCWFGFVGDGEDEFALATLEEEWSLARLVHDPVATAPIARLAFLPQPERSRQRIRLLLRGTNFQIKVWQALLNVPQGGVVCYEDIAAAIGRPTASRAVGQAIGQNPVALLIPCHRVIRKTGLVHGYRWGATRKRALLAWEAGQQSAEVA